MRLLNATTVIGSLMLIGALPAAAGQPSSSGTHIQLAADGTSPIDRDTYTRKTQDDMQEWRQKLHAFDEKAKAKGRQVDNAAENELNAAWVSTQAGARKLQIATAEGWESAKASYEKSSGELAHAWDKIRIEDK
jgi:hypothetical protein